MKQILFLLLVCVCQLHANGQKSLLVDIKIPEADKNISYSVVDKKDLSISTNITSVTKIIISSKLPEKHKLKITCNGEVKEYFKKDKGEYTFKKSIVGKTITIQQIDTTIKPEKEIDKREFKLLLKKVEQNDDNNSAANGNAANGNAANGNAANGNAAGGNAANGNAANGNTAGGNAANDDGFGGAGNNDDAIPCVSCLINQYIATNYSFLTEKSFGLYDEQANTIHLFFDYLGNSLLSTVPQGISNAKYKVHVLYPYYNSSPDELSYSVKQKSGTFSSSLLFNNTGIRDNIGKVILQSGKIPDGITERIFLLGTATDDLAFDVIVAAVDGKAIKKTVLESQTIKMSPVYHGSFDVGLLRTNLANPTFTLVTSPNSNDMVVKETNGGSRGVATIMVSFYTSPIVLLKSLIKKNKIPFYKLTGRSFLDDHKFYERIYPAIGVSVSSKSFENIFYGFNFELARGLDIFAGWNYGKVNVFNMPNYKEGTTVVTQQQFDYYQKVEWKTSTAFGVKVDALIIRNLFGN